MDEFHPFVVSPPASTENQSEAQAQEKRDLYVQSTIECFVHVCQCLDPVCQFPSCHRTKAVVRHCKNCSLKVSGNCQICQAFSTILLYHAKLCNDSNCHVPTCPKIKERLKMEALFNKAQQSLSQAELNLMRLELRGISRNTTSSVPSSSGIVPHSSSQNSLPSQFACCSDEMNRIGSLSNGNLVSVSDVKPSNSEELNRLKLQRFTHDLLHACQCRDVQCRLPKCHRFRRIVQHTRVCKLKVNENCQVCKPLVVFLFNHAKKCLDKKCIVPVCSIIKQKLKTGSVNQNVPQNEILNQLCHGMTSMNLSSSTITK